MAWQDRLYLPIVLSGLMIPFVAGLMANGWIRGLGCFLLAGLGRTFFVLGSTFCMNSDCHIWGSQPHDNSDTSRDSEIVGESHSSPLARDTITTIIGIPGNYRTSIHWYNVNMSKWVIYGLSLIGMASSLHRATLRTEVRTIKKPSSCLPL